eukprot:UC1_evm1s1140
MRLWSLHEEEVHRHKGGTSGGDGDGDGDGDGEGDGGGDGGGEGGGGKVRILDKFTTAAERMLAQCLGTLTPEMLAGGSGAATGDRTLRE